MCLRVSSLSVSVFVRADGSLLSRLLSERVGRLQSRLQSGLTALQHSVSSPRVREVIAALRDLIYELYGYLRYREESGALVRVRARSNHAASLLSPDAPPPPWELASAPGPNADHLNDEVHALLFMVQRELEAFCPQEPLNHTQMLHDNEREG